MLPRSVKGTIIDRCAVIIDPEIRQVYRCREHEESEELIVSKSSLIAPDIEADRHCGAGAERERPALQRAALAARSVEIDAGRSRSARTSQAEVSLSDQVDGPVDDGEVRESGIIRDARSRPFCIEGIFENDRCPGVVTSNASAAISCPNLMMRPPVFSRRLIRRLQRSVNDPMDEAVPRRDGIDQRRAKSRAQRKRGGAVTGTAPLVRQVCSLTRPRPRRPRPPSPCCRWPLPC